jgi:DNA-binding response OmpR family regulator
LSAEGFDVQLAVDGHDALSRLRDGTFRLVISDLNMPNLDGLDFLRVVQREYPDVSVIILTAACGTDSYIKAMNLGAVEYLCKPLKLDSLKSVMHSLAHRSSLQSH